MYRHVRTQAQERQSFVYVLSWGMTALVGDTESRASVPVLTASTSVNQPGHWVRLAMPVIAAVLDARVEVHSIGDTPHLSFSADACDLGIDSSNEEKGNGLLMRI